MELFSNAYGYKPLLVNLAGHYAKCFSSLERQHQGMLVDAAIAREEWDRAGVAGRRNIVAQRDYLNDPRHESATHFRLYVFLDDLAKNIAKARSDRASDVVVALRDVEDQIREIVNADRVGDGALIQALRSMKRQQDESSEGSINRGYRSERLTLMNQAASIFWRNAKQDDRDTHPKTEAVEKWFLARGFSETLASKAATIVRPDWAPTGRPPER